MSFRFCSGFSRLCNLRIRLGLWRRNEIEGRGCWFRLNGMDRVGRLNDYLDYLIEVQFQILMTLISLLLPDSALRFKHNSGFTIHISSSVSTRGDPEHERAHELSLQLMVQLRLGTQDVGRYQQRIPLLRIVG